MEDDNLMATVAYIFGFLSGLIIYLFNKEKYVRFHAIQSMLLCLLFFILWFFVGIIALLLQIIPFTGLKIGIIFLLVSLGLGGIWILITVFLMFRAYRGERYKLPLFGKIAERYA